MASDAKLFHKLSDDLKLRALMQRVTHKKDERIHTSKVKAAMSKAAGEAVGRRHFLRTVVCRNNY